MKTREIPIASGSSVSGGAALEQNTAIAEEVSQPAAGGEVSARCKDVFNPRVQRIEFYSSCQALVTYASAADKDPLSVVEVSRKLLPSILSEARAKRILVKSFLD